MQPISLHNFVYITFPGIKQDAPRWRLPVTERKEPGLPLINALTPRIHSTIESKREWYELREDIEQRAVDLALYIIENNATVRDAAGHFGISKSTVHKDLTERLRQVDKRLYAQTRVVLDQNKAERHLRGGEATRKKYRGE